jgi:hypothetical protein
MAMSSRCRCRNRGEPTRQLIAAFFRMALLARDLEARPGRENAAKVQSTQTEGT